MKSIINKEEEKKLTIEHLAPYLPYGLKMIFESKGGRIFELEGLRHNSLKSPINTESFFISSNNATYFIGDFKPILRPLSDYTDVNSTAMQELNTDISICIEITQFANKQKSLHSLSYGAYKELLIAHADVFNLISDGLAININTL